LVRFIAGRFQCRQFVHTDRRKPRLLAGNDDLVERSCFAEGARFIEAVVGGFWQSLFQLKASELHETF